jgi:hypothetical protein
MNTEFRETAKVGGRGKVATTFQVMPSQCTMRLLAAPASNPTAHPSVGLTMWIELRYPPAPTIGPGTLVH